jgi:hypothetical protein
MTEGGARTASAATPTLAALPIVLRCAASLERKVRYVFDTLFQAAAIPVRIVESAPEHGPWVVYASEAIAGACADGALFVPHCPEAWAFLDGVSPSSRQLRAIDGDAGFDLCASAFYFLSSWAERSAPSTASSRRLFSESAAARLDLPQDIVDRHLARLIDRLRALCGHLGAPAWPAPEWPERKRFALVLSHDVDYLPVRPFDNTVQAVKAVLRHLVRQRDPGDAWRAARGWIAATARGRDPFGCVPEIIAREQAAGVRSSWQVAVGHRHAKDVNYHIEDDQVKKYLRAITDAGFDLCLHGSYRSSEKADWYVEEVNLLGRRLARPFGSRQHFLSFDYDRLFEAQERAGIRYDMSIGYPDHPGPRAGFSSCRSACS